MMDFQAVNGGLLGTQATAGIGGDFVCHPVTCFRAAVTSGESLDVHEYILAARLRCNKAETFFIVPGFQYSR